MNEEIIEAEFEPIEILEGEELLVPPEEPHRIKCPCCHVEFYEGEELLPLVPMEGNTKVTLLRRIRQKLNEKANDPKLGFDARRIDAVAEAFITAMQEGNYNFFKEFIEREEGKVANQTNIKAEGAVKLYASALPIEGDDAP
jgi:hypothetical protein